MWVGIIQSLRVWIEQKGGGRVSLLSALAGTFIFSCPRTLALLVLGSLHSEWDLLHWLPWFSGLLFWIKTTSPAFLGFLLEDRRVWDSQPPKSCEPILKYTSFYLFLSIPSVLFLCRTLTNTRATHKHYCHGEQSVLFLSSRLSLK